MRMLFFASQNCRKCNVILNAIKQSGIDKLVSLEYIDAFDDAHEKFCDKHDVDELPHIKIYNGDKLVYESVGQCDLSDIKIACDQTRVKFNLSKQKKA